MSGIMYLRHHFVLDPQYPDAVIIGVCYVGQALFAVHTQTPGLIQCDLPIRPPHSGTLFLTDVH